MEAEPGKSFGYPKAARLRKPREFARVYQGNLFAADETLVVQAARGLESRSRLGVSVSRRVGNAVVRNRWKRLIREAFRLHQAEFEPPLDLVVRPRKGARPDFQAISRSLVGLFHRIQRKCARLPRED